MTDHAKMEQAQSVQINTNDEMMRGRYANTLLVNHSSEEFILDWLLNSPSGTHLTSRIIVSPAHMKRIIETLHSNLAQYEQKFGAIEAVSSGDRKFH